MIRFIPFLIVLALLGVSLWGAQAVVWLYAPALILAGIALLGVYDLVQTRHTLWRNFPVLGRLRWLAESMRPFFRSYMVESETEGRPFNHEERAMVYRRAKNVSSVEPFGSHLDIDAPPYEWLAHSIIASHPEDIDPRILVGAPGTAQPYSASVLNISAMSFGSLGAHAIEALNRGAAKGGFYHDSGEGGVSRYHKVGGGDLVWELGSGYFGCRARDGGFDQARFEAMATSDQVKMIEIKLSQGAKPGHGGVLPGAKVTPEIAEARGIPVGETCYSPPHHTAFSTPKEMLDFIDQLRVIIRRQARRVQALHRQSFRIPGDLQSHGRDRAAGGFHCHRWRRGRHRRGAWRVSGSCRHTTAPGPDASRAMPWSGAGLKEDIRLACERQADFSFQHGGLPGARRGLDQYRARIHVLARLYSVAALSQQYLPDRYCDLGPGPATRPGGRG